MNRISFTLFDNELWMQELAADLSAALYAKSLGLATGKYKFVMNRQKACLTHPSGEVRKAIVEYGHNKKAKNGSVIQRVVNMMPGFVYPRLRQLYADWEEVKNEMEHPTPPPPKWDWRNASDTNLIKQYMLKHNKEKES